MQIFALCAALMSQFDADAARLVFRDTHQHLMEIFGASFAVVEVLGQNKPQDSSELKGSQTDVALVEEFNKLQLACVDAIAVCASVEVHTASEASASLPHSIASQLLSLLHNSSDCNDASATGISSYIMESFLLLVIFIMWTRFGSDVVARPLASSLAGSDLDGNVRPSLKVYSRPVLNHAGASMHFY
jgi:hypothetical protein